MSLQSTEVCPSLAHSIILFFTMLPPFIRTAALTAE